MATIIPRWEWRTFGTRFGAAEARFAALTPGAVQESDELYLLSGEGDNVKVRDDLMDIKVFREVERRRPRALGAGDEGRASRCRPPTSAASSRRSGCPCRALARESYTLDQFVDELARPAGVRPVAVHKRRVRYTVGGCTAEVSDVVADGRPTRTIAIESEDAAAVVAAVRVGRPRRLPQHELPEGPRGAPRRRARALRRHRRRHELGQVPRRRARTRPAAGEPSSTAPRSRASARGSQETGEIAPAAARADGRRRSPAWPRRRGAKARCAIAAVGTAGLRIARNGDAVVDAIRARTGVAVEVIPGEEESRLAYLAAAAGLGLGDGSLVVFDTGGGSTQFTFGHGGARRRALQRRRRRGPLHGALRPRRTSSPPEVLREAMAAIAADLSPDRRPAGTRRARRDGRRGDEHHGRQARPGDLRPGRRPGHGPRPGRDRPPDRALPRRATPPAGARSSASSRSGPT